MRWFRLDFFYVGIFVLGLILLNPFLAFKSNAFIPTLKIQAVACGAAHSLILLNDGTVWGCGADKYGQLGDQSGVNHRIPVKIPVLADVRAIACGPNFSLALKKDGTVWGWGQNEQGPLGGVGNVPLQIPGLTKIVFIACGAGHAFAVKKDGTVWGWGSNRFGQIGDGTRQDRRSPIRINRLTKVKTIACGTRHSAAVKADGTVWVWGANKSGQLGDGSRVAQLIPVRVAGLSAITRVVCGSEHTVVLKKDGTLLGWGANGSGQLGDGTMTEKLQPIRVVGLEEVKAIAGGSNFNLALKKDGTLWGWGSDVFGELGDVKAVESVDECLSCGGKNNVYYYDKPKPVPVTEGTKVARIACGESFAMMVKKDGTIWSWGLNHCGQLAEGSVIDRLVPAQNYYGRIVGKRKFQYQNITAAQARARLDQEQDLFLLDVRTKEEYRQKHLRNCRLIPVTQLENQISTVVPDKDTPILIYCQVGIRSVKAANILVRLGYRNVSNLLDGINAWPYETVNGE